MIGLHSAANKMRDFAGTPVQFAPLLIGVTEATARMFRTTMTIEGFDPELAAAIAGERRRQEEHVELIASEN